MMARYDAIVIGAGPSGSAAAIHLARAGRSVAVIDKARFPRDKVCGDGLTTGALRELEDLGLDPAAVASWLPVTRCVVRSPSGHVATFPLDGRGHHAAVARRIDLDHALVQLARRAGAEVFEGHALVAASASADRIEIMTDGTSERFTAGFAIGADGMWSPLRKLLDVRMPQYLGDWHAFRQYFRNVTGRGASDLMVWFEPQLIPGYAWCFPLPDGRANVGFGLLRGHRHRIQEMKALWPQVLELPHVREALGADARPESAHRAWPIPARVAQLPLTAPRALFVGDAAAATDPMTGEGIGQALLTGRLAAEAIISSAEPEVSYALAVKRALFADTAMSNLLVKALARQRLADAAVRIADANAWTRRNFARWLFEDYPRALLVTPHRWHRHTFGRPGAFAR